MKDYLQTDLDEYGLEPEPEYAKVPAKVTVSDTSQSRKGTYVWSDAIKAKMSATRKGKKRGPMSDETKAKISMANKGRIQSAEHKLKNSLAQKGRVHSAETKAKIGTVHKGKVYSAETRAKISLGKKGIK